MARITIEVDTKQSVKAIEAIENALEKADVDVIKLEKDAKKTGKSIRNTFNKRLAGSVAGVFAGISGAIAVRGLVRIADEMTSVNARIRTVTSSTEEFNLAAEQLFQISQRTGTQILSNATSFAKLNGAIKGIGGQTGDTLSVVETLNKAFVINGSTAQEISSVMLQFAQAMGSGELRGEELRAVLEGNAFFARELAKALGVNIAGLRKMAEAGKLTTRTLLDAFPKIKETVDKTFKEIPVTVSRAMTEVENAVKRSVGIINEESGASLSLAANIQQIARAIEENQASISGFAEGIAVLISGAITGFSALSNIIGVVVGAAITLFSFFAQQAEIAFFAIKTSALTAFAAIGQIAADTLENSIKLLNEIPGVEIDVPTEIVQRLREIEEPTESIVDGIKRISEEYTNLRVSVAEQAKEYAKSAKEAITGNKKAEDSAKKVAEEQKNIAKKVAETTIIFDKATGTYKTISAAAVTSIGKQTQAWDKLGKGGQDAVKTIEQSLQRLTSKTYTVTIDVNERGGTRTSGPSGGVSRSAPRPSNTTSGPATSASTAGGASNSVVDINLSVNGGRQVALQGSQQSVADLQRAFAEQERFAA